ncbi:MAG: hypothetical protein J0H64_06035, partial [Actinobacteria bacterium]|nr:hypothetical protein [Actinomycetota bacterium]
MTEHLDDTRLEKALDEFMERAGVTEQRGLIRRILETGVGLGQDSASRLDLKISASALEEMRDAFRLFAPFAGIPKVTIFGSARTKDHDPLWLEAEQVSRRLAERGWMVVTQLLLAFAIMAMGLLSPSSALLPLAL